MRQYKQRSGEPLTKTPDQRPPEGVTPASHQLLRLQRLVGNHSVERLISTAAIRKRPIVQRDPDPTIHHTKPRHLQIKLAPDDAVVFRTQTATIGGLRVSFSGRMAINGNAALVGEELPKLKPDQFLQKRVHEQLTAAFNAAKPTGSATQIELLLANEPIVLELVPGAERSPAFQATGHLTPARRNLALDGCTVDGATLILDATAWIEPATPAPAPVDGTPAPEPTDASVTRLAFGGSEAHFADAAKKGDPARTGGVTLKSAMDSFEQDIPAIVKGHNFLKLPEQRAAFLQEMRAYFGTDTATIAHFKQLRVANVKGAQTILHEEAAVRLEAVEQEIGRANMPSSGGVGWPRAECSLAGQQGLGNLHNIGFAVDYNATEAPHLKDQRRLDLIQIVTGRSATADFSAGSLDTKANGQSLVGNDQAKKDAVNADPKVQDWLDKVGTEAEALGQASEDFRGSLTITDATGTTDGVPKLVALRERWFAAVKAKDAEEQAKVRQELQVVIKPWLDKVQADRTAMIAKITAAGFDPQALPSAADLAKAAKLSGALEDRVQTQQRRLGATLARGQRAALNKLIAEARKALSEPPDPLADDTMAIAEFARLADLLTKQHKALVQKQWLERIETLQTALSSDMSLLFGKRDRPDKFAREVVDPGLAQMADTGFFTLRGTPKAGAEAFGVDFIKSMLKHGFTHGGTWSTPDLMHFELRWKGPGQQ